ncbi:MAG: hypothetical protein N4A72_19040 [Bacteroidales bacterium]|jgi:hypothetical protein|nr:hypothetical protein [Bacteroidales bacterium]
MGLFTKLFKKEPEQKRFDNDDLRALLNSSNITKQGVPEGFYTKLFKLYTDNVFDKQNEDHNIALKQFISQIDELSVIYNNIISSGFDKELLDKFLKRFIELTSAEYKLLVIKQMMCSYWYQLIRKNRTEIENTRDKDLILLFDEFHAKYRSYVDEIMFPKH